MERTIESASPLKPATTGATVCPFCRQDTGLEREIDAELGSISVAEFEILVRNQWRGRLGPSSYERDHSRRVIRALIVYALAPHSPIRYAVTRQLIWWELTALGTWGLDRAGIDQEFRALTHAVREVLARTGFDGDRVETLMRAVEDQVWHSLGRVDSTELSANLASADGYR